MDKRSSGKDIVQLTLIIATMISLVLTNSTGLSSDTVVQGAYNPGFTASEPIRLDLRPDQDDECFVPCDELRRGASKDGIPAIDDPQFQTADENDVLNDQDIVIGIVIDGEARAYPYEILNWHEIVNDKFGDQHVSITYCPLTGSSLIFKTSVLGNSELGVSGKLYENNLVFYDRNTDNYWSQMLHTLVKGDNIGAKLDFEIAVESSWGAWKKLHPETLLLTRDTSWTRNYDRYPYGNYLSNEDILFPTSFNPQIKPYSLFHHKTITQILEVNGETLLLPFESLTNIPALNFKFAENSFVTFYHEEERLASTFKAKLTNGSELAFAQVYIDALSEEDTLDLPIYLDQFENVWNFNGIAIQGPNSGEKLEMFPTYNAFWFAASTFYHDASILLPESNDDFTGENGFSDIPTEYTLVSSPKVASEYVTFSVDPTITADPIDFNPIWIVAFPLMIVLSGRIRGITKKFTNVY